MVDHLIAKSFLFVLYSSKKKEMPFTDRINSVFSREFRHNQCTAVFANPGACCFDFCCPPCAVYLQRKRLLDITKEPYVMCAGTFPCCGLEKPMPEICLFVEVCYCLSKAHAANKFMAQTRLGLKNDSLDDCVSCCNCFVSLEFMCLRMCFDCSPEKEEIVKGACCILPCASCQVASELSRAEKDDYITPPATVIAALPEHFSNVGITLAGPPLQARPL